jgi:YegS/Rv2252/BmrU family lipid kinase
VPKRNGSPHRTLTDITHRLNSARKFLVFINPISGTSGKEKTEALIRGQLNALQYPYSVIHTRKDGNYTPEKEKALGEGITDVIICGGDGTINSIASFFTNSDIRLGIIPMGSGNGLAYALRIPMNVQKALDVIIQGKAGYIDAFQVNGRFACMLAGLGLDGQIAHDFSEQKKRGLLTYIRISAWAFFKTSTYPLTLHLEDKKIDADIRFVSIANSNQFGNRVTIAPKASLSDGKLDIVVVKKKNRLFTVIAVMRQILFGKIQEGDVQKNRNILYYQSSEISIDNPLKAPLHIDGEPVETNVKVEIEILPSAMLVIQPL